MKDSRGYHGCKRPRSALPPAPGRLHACRRTGRVPPPGPGERKSPAFRRRGSGSAGAQGPESDRAAPSRRRRPHRRGTRRERWLLPRRAGARTRGLFKSRGRAGPDRARRQGAAAACAGLGLLRHRGALSPAQLRPRPPAVRTSPLGSARLGSVRPAQPSPASPGPPEPPRLGPRWSPLPRSGGESRLGAAAGGRPAAEVRVGGGRLGLARHSGRCPAGSSTDGFPLSPVREVPGSGFFLPGRPGGAGRCLATPAPGRSGPGCSARLFGYPLFLRRGSSE